MLEWLFPDERKFYMRFSGVAHQLSAAATLLEQGFDRPALWPELSISIEKVDDESDAAAYDLDLGRGDHHGAKGDCGLPLTTRLVITPSPWDS
jgi:hypothetical protein